MNQTQQLRVVDRAMPEPTSEFLRRARRDIRTTIVILAALAVAWWLFAAPGESASAAPETITGPVAAPQTDRLWLTVGATGDDVRAVQSFLDGHGWTLAVDGEYGPVTAGVVSRLQEMSGLEADGVWGPVTDAAFGGVAATDTPAVRQQPSKVLPVDGDCSTWEPLFVKYGLPVERASQLAWREGRCSHVIADRPSTRDLSVGTLQVNWYGSLARMWTDAGWSWDQMVNDPEAAIAGAGALFRMCGGWGPWTPPYSCATNDLPSPSEMGYTP